jgi:hypothetical protein
MYWWVGTTFVSREKRLSKGEAKCLLWDISQVQIVPYYSIGRLYVFRDIDFDKVDADG